MKQKTIFCARTGYTLVELITVLAILAVMAFLAVSSLTGFVEKAREERYVLEAQEVRRSLELYLIDRYDSEIDTMELLSELTTHRLCAREHPLADYMTVACSEGAAIEGMTLDLEKRRVVGLIYRAGGFRIELEDGETTVTRIKERKRKGAFGRTETACGKE